MWASYIPMIAFHLKKLFKTQVIWRVIRWKDENEMFVAYFKALKLSPVVRASAIRGFISSS
jgi:hypothetical protein